MKIVVEILKFRKICERAAIHSVNISQEIRDVDLLPVQLVILNKALYKLKSNPTNCLSKDTMNFKSMFMYAMGENSHIFLNLFSPWQTSSQIN